MRFKPTLILLGIGVVVALVFFLIEQPRHGREVEKITRGDRLTAVSPGDVHTLTVHRPEFSLIAQREGDRWKLLSPVMDRSDDGAVNMLLHAACEATVDRRFDVEKPRLSEYGLEPPAAILELAAKDGRNLLDIRIGELNLIKSHCYAALADATEVLLLPTGVRRYALRPLFDFRSKKILETAVDEVLRLEIADRGRSMVWAARGDGDWFTVEKGDTIRGDGPALEDVLQRLRGLRAREIPIDGSARAADYLAPRAGTISLWLKPDSARTDLAFSNARDGGCYVEVSGSHRVALVDTTMLGVFAKTLDDFRDRRVLHFDANALAKLVANTPRGTLTMVKTGPQWTFPNPSFGDLDERTMQRLLSRIEKLKFSGEFRQRTALTTAHGLDEPTFRLTLLGADGRVIDELDAGAPIPETPLRYVWSRSTGLLAGIDSTSVSEVERDLEDLGAR